MLIEEKSLREVGQGEWVEGLGGSWERVVVKRDHSGGSWVRGRVIKNAGSQELRLTEGHHVIVERDGSFMEMPAREVRVGDWLGQYEVTEVEEEMFESGDLVTIVTESGSFLIQSNGSSIPASCRAEGDGSSWLYPLIKYSPTNNLPQQLTDLYQYAKDFFLL